MTEIMNDGHENINDDANAKNIFSDLQKVIECKGEDKSRKEVRVYTTDKVTVTGKRCVQQRKKCTIENKCRGKRKFAV